MVSIVFTAPALSSEWPEMSIYHLDGEWTDHEGASAPLERYSGKLVVLSMVYTSCQHSCPMITSKMITVKNALNEKHPNDIVYALVSFDTDADTVEVLKNYKNKRELDDNWVMLRSTEKEIRELSGVLGVNYKKMPDGGFSHSNIITLLDKNGVVVNQVDGLHTDISPMLKKIDELLVK